MSSYLGFNGEEYIMFKELKEVFELMNYKDPQQCFSREIQLFEKVIRRLSNIRKE